MVDAPHQLTLPDGRLFTITLAGVARVTREAPDKWLESVARCAMPGPLPQEVVRWHAAFWERLEAVKVEVRRDEPWFVYYQSDLDGWRYSWLRDRKEQCEDFQSAQRIT